MTHLLSEKLHIGLQQAGLELAADAQQKLLYYIDLLVKWNRSYNLTAVRKPEQMVTRHLLDSLVISPYLQGRQILDVGSGAGLPGIPLAVMYPEREFTLIDSNGKKTRFITQAAAELGLTNVNVIQSRIDLFQSATEFDSITARAFSTIKDLLSQTQHLIAKDGIFLVMKGVFPAMELEELGELADKFAVTQTHELEVPELDAERHLLIIKRANN